MIKQTYATALLQLTLQSRVNVKLSKQRFWPCYENGPIKIIQTIPHTRWNESFLNDKGDSGDESSAKVLFKQPPTIHV